MAVELGRKFALYVSASSGAAPTPPTGKIAKAYDASFPQEPKKADLSSNDSGARDEHRVAGFTGDLSFKMWLDRADAGQALLFAAVDVDGSGTGMVNVVYDPEGTTSGKRRFTFLASVSLKQDAMRDGHQSVDVTLSPSGTLAPTTI